VFPLGAGVTPVFAGGVLGMPPLPDEPPAPGWLGSAAITGASSSPEQAIAVQIATALASSQTVPERIELFSKPSSGAGGSVAAWATPHAK
jgi:hypothetical protein